MASSLQQQQHQGGVAAGKSGSNNGGSGSGPLGGPLSGSGSGAVLGAAGAGALASGSSTQKARTAPSAPSELRQPNLPATTPAHQQQPPPTQQGPTVLTFALNHRPRATRASVPKVRTGCKTCKKRHVKCDEAKPSCSRCIKWQGFCEGYDQAAESVSNDAATQAAAPQPATTTATAPTTTARPKTTPRATPTTTPAGTPPGASKTPRNRNPTKTCPNGNPTAKTTRAPSTTSSSSATQNSRRTTPSSDVSASEYVHSTTAQPLPTNTSRTSTPSIKREPDDDTPRAQYGDHPIYVGDDDSNASVIFIPREPVYFQNQQQTQRQFKREYDDEDDVEAEYYTHDAYAPDFVVAQRNTSTQPFFDLSLINGGGTSSSFPLEPNYNSVMFASQWEKAYFDSWLTLAPNLGGGWFPSHLWTSTIPQLCRDEPAVRFAAIAIGAMAQAMSPALLGKSYHHMLGGNTTADGQPSQPGQPGADGTTRAFPVAESVEASRVVPHYRNALTYYGHALRLLRLGGGGGTATSENNNGNQPQQPYTGNDPETPPSAEKERAAVLSCLLFVCFEALQGNREVALHHITHGLQIVDQFVARNLPPRALSEAQAYSPPDEASLLAGTDSDAEWQRRRQRQRQRDRQLGLLAAKQGEAPTNAADNAENGHRTTLSEDRPSDSLTRVLTRSPAPYVLEDEVMQVFRRLDFQAWSLGVFRLRRTRPADIKFQALDALNPATIPARFDTLDDARRWWDFVQHWILQFPRYMVAALQRYMDENPDAAARATAAGRMLDICDVPGAREIQREYLECLERWYAAFYPLYEATRRQGGHPTYGHGGDPAAAAAAEAAYFRAASLKIPYLLAWIGVSSLVYSDYEAMYQLTPQFRELNRLAALILPKQPRYAWSPFGGGASSIFGPPPGGASGGAVGSDGVRGDLFTMDNGPTMALFVVSCKCRVEAVRDESIRLLAAYPRRDGFWDSKILWAIADWNRVIEAENETEGSLYEQWLRLRQREAIFDETKPEVQMTAWVKNAATGKFEKLTQTVRWDR